MLPSRYAPPQSSAIRKSRLERPSMIPKSRRQGSTDRLSTEARRPSTAGHRSSSAEPRATFGRLSREASATKLPMNGRSRSQQSYGQASMTPLRSSAYSGRPTTTPVKSPSEDRSIRNWQTSLERALAFVTYKDKRAISNVAWQRAEWSRVQAALATRGAARGAAGGAAGGAFALMKPLTIARFVEVTGSLLGSIWLGTKLNTDNYVTKLPNMAKRLLYPGTVSKSWLKTVNTLHAFPHALALISYLLDLEQHIETPVQMECLYIENNERAFLRHDYVRNCWIRFQDPDYQFDDLREEYLQNLQALLGNDDEKIAELVEVIEKYESCLNDSAEQAAIADEQQRSARRDALLTSLREARGRRGGAARGRAGAAARGEELRAMLAAVDAEIERATVASQQLSREISSQTLSVSERSALLDDLDYAARVLDSKRALADQIAKMVLTKETELALWQKKSLDSCVEYKQGLIHLAADHPDLAALAVDEKELMSPTCASYVSGGVETLRARAAELQAARADGQRRRGQTERQRALLLEDTRAKIADLKQTIQRTQEAAESELRAEAAECAEWAAERAGLSARAGELGAERAEYERVDAELEFWVKQDEAWRSKLTTMREYIEAQKEESKLRLEEAKKKRAQLLLDNIRLWNMKLNAADN